MEVLAGDNVSYSAHITWLTVVIPPDHFLIGDIIILYIMVSKV